MRHCICPLLKVPTFHSDLQLASAVQSIQSSMSEDDEGDEEAWGGHWSLAKLQSDVAIVLVLASLGSIAPGRLLMLILLNVDVVVSMFIV